MSVVQNRGFSTDLTFAFGNFCEGKRVIQEKIDWISRRSGRKDPNLSYFETKHSLK